MTTLKTPPIWDQTAYIRPIEVINDGARGWTHLSELRPPTGPACRAYVKHYPAELTRGLFNEWFGYTVMKALGVPQPESALMPAPVFCLPGKPIAWAFVSCQPRPTFEGTPKQLYNIRDPAQHTTLLRRLFDCPALPLLIAADQLLKNADRNLGNLVFTGKSSFVAIDHSDILGGPAWSAGETHYTQQWSTSVLIERFETLSGLKPSIRNAIVSSAELISEEFYKAQNDLAEAFCANTNQDAKAAQDMIWWRTIALVEWFKEKMHVL